MRICTWDEFVKLPAGTIYTLYTPHVFDGLYRRGGVLTSSSGEIIDFYAASLLPHPDDRDYDAPPILDDIECRDGTFDHDQLFCVYEAEDLKVLKQMLGV